MKQKAYFIAFEELSFGFKKKLMKIAETSFKYIFFLLFVKKCVHILIQQRERKKAQTLKILTKPPKSRHLRIEDNFDQTCRCPLFIVFFGCIYEILSVIKTNVSKNMDCLPQVWSLNSKCDTLHDLVLFVQFKKTWKHP